MSQKVQLDKVAISCSICLDLLTDPVTIPCGHNYCIDCIKAPWNKEDSLKIYSCPQCRQTFTPRPVLIKNTMLADLVEQLKKMELQAETADHCYAGPEDVACDLCTGRKLKALKSCLVCLASFCQNHLQPHHDAAPLKRHKLVEPSNKLQENICSHHDEVMKMFCRTDQQCICYLCSVDEHKGHDTVSAAAEITERQRELERRRQNIQQRIQDREKEVKLLQQEVEDINHSADKTVEDSENILTELIRLMEKRRSDVKQQIRSQQETEVSRFKELQEKLEQEITDLKRRDAELEQLSHTEDHNEFLKYNFSLTCVGESTNFSMNDLRCLQHFDSVEQAITEVREKILDIFNGEWTKIFTAFESYEPITRYKLLNYSCQNTLDPNTLCPYLSLSDDNRKITFMTSDQCYPGHPDRYTVRHHVLSRESLIGRCYWEVEKGVGGVSVVVSYKDSNTPKETFGKNDKSWALDCFQKSYKFWYNNITIPISGPRSSRIGVYLDHRAGVLCFYSVSETMTLLHRVQTTFTQPLHAGLYLYGPVGNTAEICNLLH